MRAGSSRSQRAALRRGRAGEAYNLSGWEPVTLRAALEVLEEAFGRRASIESAPGSAVEAFLTRGCGLKAVAELGNEPRTDLGSGLRAQIAAAAPDRLVA